MDLNDLSSVTTGPEMLTWLAVNCITPVTPVITASDLGAILQKIVDVSGGPVSELVSFDTKTAAYTLTLNDKAIDMNAAAAVTLTVPLNANAAFPVGTQILLTGSGAGQVTVAGATGVTINAADGKLGLRARYSGASLIKRGTDTWWLVGDLA